MVFPLIVLFTIDTDKQNADNARRIMELYQKTGLNEKTWNIYNTNIGFLPTYNHSSFEKWIGWKKEFRPFSEKRQDYVSRVIHNGKNIFFTENIYSVLGNVGLEFRASAEEDKTVLENRVFFDPKIDARTPDSKLEKVEGIVPIHIHVLTLEYVKWHPIKDLNLKYGYRLPRPENIVYL
jgi:hypothetical protein